MDPGQGRKRRKWDVAAPEGLPANPGITPAGAPAFGFASPALSSHFIPQGLNPSFGIQQPAQPKPLLDVKDLKPGQPLDASLIAKAQAAAAAAVANINKVTLLFAPCPLLLVPCASVAATTPVHARLARFLVRDFPGVKDVLCLAFVTWLMCKLTNS